ncbi:hypothetical protein BJX96DRAFT_168730 [Aspergillus floccosus]
MSAGSLPVQAEPIADLDDDSGVEFDDRYTAQDRDQHHYLYYPTRHRNRQLFPVDERERDHQSRQFVSYLDLFQGRLCSPLARTARTVLDVKTGAGCWAIQFADEHPSSAVYGIDEVRMQDDWVPVNCEFILQDLHEPCWYYPYGEVDVIHIGPLWGDSELLACLLDGAYRCCAPDGVVEIWDSTVCFQDPTGEGCLHRLYREMEEAYISNGRSLDLPLLYASELKSRGFVNVVEDVYHLPLNLEVPGPEKWVVKSWADGLEAYCKELLVELRGKSSLEVLLFCAAARQDLRQGVDGWLQM